MSLRRPLRALYLRSGIREVLPTPVKNAIRRRWVTTARRIGYPISTPKLPRPDLDPGRRYLRLTHVLVASDLNPRYLESWELIRAAWQEIAAVEPHLVLIADELPEPLAGDPLVHLFRPVRGLHSAFQAQCIRLLYPALLTAPGELLISDMELAPLDPRYFHAPLARLDDRFFVPYRDILLQQRMVAVPYNAARPEVWGEVFGIATEEDVGRRLAEWAERGDYTGQRGGPGWYTDQEVLYETLLAWGARTDRLWMLDDEHTGFNRLNRPELKAEGGVTPRRRTEILARRYTDYNSAVPHSEYRALNDEVVELARASLGRARRGRDVQDVPLRSP